MPEKIFADIIEMDDEFDPLMVDDEEINQEDMDDDNPLDTVDYPTMRNMPEHMQRGSVYTPEAQGSAQAAIVSLFDHNPGRRPVLLAIIDMCRQGCVSSSISEQVEVLQENNRSVYAPMTLCRMLERAGALELETIEAAAEKEDPEEGVEYLEIKERVDPVWVATAEGLSVYADFTQGAAFRDIMQRDGKYIAVYHAVMESCHEKPRSKNEIEELVDTFEVVLTPRRFGGHFIDMLERTDALEWKNHAWQLTDLGRELLADMQSATKE